MRASCNASISSRGAVSISGSRNLRSNEAARPISRSVVRALVVGE
jgi:hypothetical protein